MTPTYIEENSLNVIEWDRGRGVRIPKRSPITPAVRPQSLSLASFLVVSETPVVTTLDCTGDIISLEDFDDIRASDAAKKEGIITGSFNSLVRELGL